MCPKRKPSCLIWQKLICSKFEDLIDDRGGRGSYRGGAPGALTRVSLGSLRTGHPVVAVVFTGLRAPVSLEPEGGSLCALERASPRQDPHRHLNL